MTLPQNDGGGLSMGGMPTAFRVLSSRWARDAVFFCLNSRSVVATIFETSPMRPLSKVAIPVLKLHRFRFVWNFPTWRPPQNYSLTVPMTVFETISEQREAVSNLRKSLTFWGERRFPDKPRNPDHFFVLYSPWISLVSHALTTRYRYDTAAWLAYGGWEVPWYTRKRQGSDDVGTVVAKN